MDPRRKNKKRVVQIGRRTLGQLFRLLPGEEVNRVFGYLLARYLTKYGIVLHAAVFMGNHYHLLVSADEPTIELFTQDLNSQIARYLNWRHGLVHVNLWAPVKPAEIECLDPESAWDDVIYIATNPVAALIVPRPDHHPGVIVLPSDWGKPLTFEPPTEFFRFDARGDEPITLVPMPPPGFEDVGLEDLASRANHEIEMRCRRIRRSGAKFRGYEDVDPFDCPRKLWARRIGLNVANFLPSARFDNAGDSLFDSCPRYQAADKSLIKKALDLDRHFNNEYRACREAERDGDLDVVYPEGTSRYRRLNRARTEPLVDRGWYPLLNYE